MTQRLRDAGVPEARNDPVLRRYPLRRLRLPVGGRILSLVVPDAAARMRAGDWVGEVLRGGEPPHWLRVWPAAVAVARYLARAGSLSGVRVLDLGCGVGVPGTTASWLGARVQFADRESDALAFATWNARAHAGQSGTVAAQRLDWNASTVDGQHDVVLLADVTYRLAHHGPLRRQLDRVLADCACAIHADPLREASSRFLQELTPAFVLRSRSLDVEFRGRKTPMRLTVVARTASLLRQWSLRFGDPEAEDLPR